MRGEHVLLRCCLQDDVCSMGVCQGAQPVFHKVSAINGAFFTPSLHASQLLWKHLISLIRSYAKAITQQLWEPAHLTDVLVVPISISAFMLALEAARYQLPGCLQSL